MRSRFLRDEQGSTAVEFALVAVLLLATTIGVFEIGFMLYQWNACEKATHFAVRRAAVADPVAPEVAIFNGIDGPSQVGTPCRNAEGAVLAECIPDTNPITCTSSGCTGFGFSAASFNVLLAEAQRVAPWVQPQNLQVQYTYTGLGFVGRPGGLPVAVTVRLVNLTFSFIVIDVLLGLADVGMPPFAATLISEDLNSGPAI